MQTDNGGEFTSNYMRSNLEWKGIKLQTTTPYMPEQNGVAERMNRTVVDQAHAMLTKVGLPTRYWKSAMATASQVTNRIPSNVTGRNSPFEMWTGIKPDIQHLKVFRCRA